METKITSVVNNQGHQYKQWMVALIVNVTLFTYGLQSGWMSPTIELLRSTRNPEGYPFSESMISWIASGMFMASVASTLFYSYIADYFGRRPAMLVIVFTQALTWIIKLVSAHPISLLIARLMSGVASGGIFNVIPIYIKEISEDSIRGALGSTIMIGQGVGYMVMYGLGAYLDYYTILYIVTGIPIASGVLYVFVPESPSYLVKKKKIEEATRNIAYLRGLKETDKIVVEEIAKMQKEEEQYGNLPQISMKDIWRNPVWRRGVIIVVILMTLLDSTGTMAISTYAASIVSVSSDGGSPGLKTLSFPAVMVLGSIISMSVIEKCGRKPLMVISLILTGSSLAVLASVILIQEQGGWVPGWLSIFAIIVALFSYGVGLLPVPYVVMAEIFNFQIRAKITGYNVTLGWFLCFLQIKTFGPISESLGMYTMFFIFSGMCFFGAIVCFIILPETKGKSLEEIEAILVKQKVKESECQ
ncbi:Facilitated trehalose transporter Tret1 [Eumeta japonica]|uniref:Facilitated trehalose transporter Tret1 n=1 Tax=Eumeta variegata TaxID=151549 RepID=A0A4C1W1A3_EUMVA|nr:Facilitated trehalose transporter Tret1 [Eumeta japonica]